MDKQEVIKEFDKLKKLSLSELKTKIHNDETVVFNGKKIEFSQYPLALIETLGDKELLGYANRVWEEWASEAGDYEGGIWELASLIREPDL